MHGHMKVKFTKYIFKLLRSENFPPPLKKNPDWTSSYTLWSKSLCTPDDYNSHIFDDLKMAITEYIQNVDRAVLNTVFENTVRSVNKCLETGGGEGVGSIWKLLVTFCIVIIRCTETFWSPCIYYIFIV